ncbi:MAG: carboxymuconolactone decarboxylase family protein [Rhodospirillales bacterium]|nr:MAG: carboxymuconolactone decarboxylase family protein [Rhodospirillales bacterium]
MRTLLATLIAAGALAFAPIDTARADDPPEFMTETWPERAVSGAWEEYQAVFDPDGALDAKTKALIALAVSAKVPCEYCVYYHTASAKSHGATDEQIIEALASGALVRKWSNQLQGTLYDMDEWRAKVDAMFTED